MRLLATSLLNLPVVTESGTRLGRVSDIECNVDGWTIGNIQLQSGWFTKITRIISVAQIVRVETNKVVVRDAAVPATDMAVTGIQMPTVVTPSLNRDSE